MSTTLRDVAKRAGCAISTASNVLNKKQRLFPISEETKQRVLSAADELGYHPNMAAKSLRRSKSNNIGLIYSAQLAGMNDLLAGDVLAGVGTALSGSDYDLIVYSGFEDIKQRIIKAAHSKSVDGLLYFIHTSTYDLFHHEIVQELDALDIPIMGMQLFQQHEQKRSVGLHLEAALELSVAHLYDLGHRSIAMVNPSPERLIGFSESLRGFQAACSKRSVVNCPVYSLDTIAELVGGQDLSRYHIGQLFARYICERDELLPAYHISSDLIAAGFRDELASRGLHVPQDVAIVGQSNELNPERGSDFFTTIDTRRQDIAETAARRLVGIIDNDPTLQENEFTCLEPRLILRASCGAKRQVTQERR